MTQWIRILELIGGAAFALSGAAAAMEHGLDIFGLLVLALTTAAGGGVLRDLLLGQTPPAVFSDPLYIAVPCCNGAVCRGYKRCKKGKTHPCAL